MSNFSINRKLRNIFEKKNYKLLYTNATKELNKNPSDKGALMYQSNAIYHQYSAQTKTKAAFVEIFDHLDIKSVSEDNLLDLLKCTIDCDQFETVTKFFNKRPELSKFLNERQSLCTYIIYGLLWTSQYKQAKEFILFLISKCNCKVLGNTALFDVMYVELLSSPDGSNKKMILKILLNKLKKNGIKSSSNSYLSASISHELKNHSESLKILKSIPISEQLEIHDFYIFTLNCKLGQFDESVLVFKKFIESKIFDSGLLTIIFEENDVPRKSDKFSKFLDDIKKVIEDSIDNNEESEDFKADLRQYDLLFNFQYLIYTKDTKKDTDSFASLLARYYEEFGSKPFCLFDIKFFIHQMIEKGVISPEKLKESFASYFSKEHIINPHDLSEKSGIDRETLHSYQKYVCLMFIKFFIGYLEEDDPIAFSENAWIIYTNYRSKTDDSELLYPVKMLIILCTNLLESKYHSTGKNIYLFTALNLLESASDTKIENFYLFDAKKLLISSALGLPDLYNTISSFEMNQTQFDSLFYLFIERFRTCYAINDFSETLEYFKIGFESIKEKTFEVMQSNHLTKIEDFADFFYKTSTSTNMNIFQIFTRIFTQVNHGYLSTQDPIDFDLNSCSDLSDFYICESFNSLSSLSAEQTANIQRKELVEWLHASSDSEKFKKYFVTQYFTKSKNLNLVNIKTYFPDSFSKITRYIADFICLLKIDRNLFSKTDSKDLLYFLSDKFISVWKDEFSLLKKDDGLFKCHSKVLNDLESKISTLHRFYQMVPKYL